MARTRSKPLAKAPEESKEDATTKKPILALVESNPPKLFILPKNVSADARILTLPNSASSKGTRHLLCPETGLYEFTAIAAPSAVPRSLLITSHRFSKEPGKEELEEEMDEKNKPEFFSDCILRSASLYVATPLDPMFLLLPIIAPASGQKKGKGMFLTLEDHSEQSPEQLKCLLRTVPTRELFEGRLGAICDSVEAGDETMFRLSVEKLVGELLAKANRMVTKNLPATMEERFIRQALQAPVLTLKREETKASEAPIEEPSQPDPANPQDPASSTKDSQESLAPDATNSTAATSFSDNSPVDPKADAVLDSMKYLLRIRTSINFMLQSYLPSHLRSLVQSHLATNTLLDFTPLDTHLQTLASLREEAKVLRSLSDNTSHKRPIEDDEQQAIRSEKKRKREEEEKRRKSEGRAIKQLKKADTCGMKKMSSFFTKVAAKK